MSLENAEFLPETVSTNYSELAAATALTGLAMLIARNNGYPELIYPFDLNEHANHPVAGLAIGYIIERSVVCVDRLKKYSRQITFTTGAIIASLFELKHNLWYRNTTSDAADSAYTMLGVAEGIRCVTINKTKHFLKKK